jgi:hypothetical protein
MKNSSFETTQIKLKVIQLRMLRRQAMQQGKNELAKQIMSQIVKLKMQIGVFLMLFMLMACGGGSGGAAGGSVDGGSGGGSSSSGGSSAYSYARTKSTVVHLYGSVHVTEAAITGSSLLNDVARIADSFLRENSDPDIQFRTGGSINSVVAADVANGTVENQDYVLFEKAGVHDCDHAAYSSAMNSWHFAATNNTTRLSNRVFFTLPFQQNGPTGCIAMNSIINGNSFSNTISTENSNLGGESVDVNGYMSLLNAGFVANGYPITKGNGYSLTVWGKIGFALVILKDLNEVPSSFTNLVAEIMTQKDALVADGQAPSSMTSANATSVIQSIVNQL